MATKRMRGRQERAMAQQVAGIFEAAGYSVSEGGKGRGRRPGIDMVAERFEFGQGERIILQIKDLEEPMPAAAVRKVREKLDTTNLAECWIVANHFTDDALIEARRSNPAIRLFTLDELETSLSLLAGRSKARARAARTEAGKAILSNATEIGIVAAALLLLIDERLIALRDGHPNSHEAKKLRDQAIADYQRLRRDVQGLAEATAKFKAGAGNEREAVEASKTFAEGVRNWWTKSHERICDKAFDMGLFTYAVSICSMAGSGGKMAVALSAAMVGGKQLSDALKGFKGIWK